MELPALPLKGACLCGAVEITATAPPLLTLACHCRGCQKLCASAFSLTTMFPRDAVTYSGELIKGGLGTPGRAHYFCKSCLNFVFSQLDGAEYRINLRTSVLDQAALFEPFVEVMTKEKMPWVNLPAVHSYAKYPTSLEELQALMNAYGATD